MDPAREGSTMIISIQFENSRTDDTKRAGAKAMTEAAVATLGVKPEWVTVLYENYDKENWAIGGELLLDRHAAREKAAKAGKP
ncbi:tautomerase family protein [Chelatococcus asaccharovorans]|nr:tautomerase family protein [Chelatococcus asaccharovorans]